ncbi:MAG: glycosyltransferase family 2 protein [Betaproteobacteria bacterium]|nr:glycosyltransferase family 2 protein [Betaproteobacteria bacterium]
MDAIGVVIPTYKARKHILGVLGAIGPEVSRIYVVDDCCPEHSGDYVLLHCQDSRLRVIKHQENRGVGGAVITGYRAAIADDLAVIVKIDSDGQMDPSLLLDFAMPILRGEADYTKGNRFFDLEGISQMPRLRLIGNAALSLITKLSTGYWNLFDPTNGYTAIHTGVARRLPFHKISERYFFESDMLFRLNTFRAVVMDVPMDAKYGDEQSNLKISKIIGEFLRKHLINMVKRIFYNYYLRDMSLASIELPLGLLLFCFGVIYGGFHWLHSASVGVATPAGSVMLAAAPALVGLQLVLAFLSYDINSVPKRPLAAGHFVRRHSP